MMTSAEYLREARKRRKMSKRQVGAMMARMCEMQSGILPMWRMSADGHQAALQRMERQSQFCTWEDSRLIAEILQVGEEGANRILTTRDVRTAINHVKVKFGQSDVALPCNIHLPLGLFSSGMEMPSVRQISRCCSASRAR